MLPTKLQVNWPFGSGEEAKNRFSRWLLWRPSWISDRINFSYFWSTSHPGASYQVTLRFRRRSEKWIFKMAATAVIFDFWSERFLAIFDLQVIPILPTKFQVNWPFDSGEETIKYCHGGHQISDRNDFTYFKYTSHPDAFKANCWRRTTNDARQTLVDQNSSPWALRAQVS